MSLYCWAGKQAKRKERLNLYTVAYFHFDRPGLHTEEEVKLGHAPNEGFVASWVSFAVPGPSIVSCLISEGAGALPFIPAVEKTVYVGA